MKENPNSEEINNELAKLIEKTISSFLKKVDKIDFKFDYSLLEVMALHNLVGMALSSLAEIDTKQDINLIITVSMYESISRLSTALLKLNPTAYLTLCEQMSIRGEVFCKMALVDGSFLKELPNFSKTLLENNKTNNPDAYPNLKFLKLQNKKLLDSTSEENKKIVDSLLKNLYKEDNKDE